MEHASNRDFIIQNLQLYEYKVRYVSGHDFKAFQEKGMDLPQRFSKEFVSCTYTVKSRVLTRVTN